MVDAAPARVRVKNLCDAGMRQQAIADAAKVSMAAIGILLHGHYTPSRPAQRTIHADVAERLLAVQFVGSAPRPAAAGQRCEPSERFYDAGYRVGRCADCGELAPLRTAAMPGGWRIMLVGHPTLDATAGDDL